MVHLQLFIKQINTQRVQKMEANWEADVTAN